MGIQGLRKYIEVAAAPKSLQDVSGDGDQNGGGSSASTWEHVLFDLNCLIYQAYSKEHSTAQQTIQAFLELLDSWVSRVRPTKSVTFVLDGSAPLAKLRTQRQRRRKSGNMDTTTNSGHSEISITAGSLFMSQLETALVSYAKNCLIAFGLSSCVVAGSSCPGEGEAKISQVLNYSIGNSQRRKQQQKQQKAAAVASKKTHKRNSNQHNFDDPDQGDANEEEDDISEWVNISKKGADDDKRQTTRGKTQKRNESGLEVKDSADPTVLIVGNDIDLLLTCLGATHLLNIQLLEPRTASVFEVDNLLRKWCSSLNITSREDLSRVRADFIFLFCLNGGDHYVGLGDASVDLWRRYRQHRSLNKKLQIVTDDSQEIDLATLGEISGSSSYTGMADATLGVNLIAAALWGTVSTISGVCPGYNFDGEGTIEGQPMLANLHAAVKARAAGPTGPYGAGGTVSVAADITPQLPQAPDVKKQLDPKKPLSDETVASLLLASYAKEPMPPLMNYLTLIPSSFHLPHFVNKTLSRNWTSSATTGTSGAKSDSNGESLVPQQQEMQTMYSSHDIKSVLATAKRVVDFLSDSKNTTPGAAPTKFFGRKLQAAAAANPVVALTAEERRLLSFKPMVQLRLGMNRTSGKPAIFQGTFDPLTDPTREEKVKTINDAVQRNNAAKQGRGAEWGRQKRARSAGGVGGLRPSGGVDILPLKKKKLAPVRGALPEADNAGMLSLNIDV